MAQSEIRPTVVAQMNLSGAWGGMEMSTLKIARFFKEQGHSSWIVTSVDSILGKEARKAGIETFELGAEGHFAPLASMQLRRFFKEEKVEAVMVHQLRNLWILRPALWGLNRVRAIGFARMFIKNINKKDFLHRHLYGRLEKLVCLSAAQAKMIAPCLPVAPERYLVIPNGVDVNRFHPQHRSDKVRRELFNADDQTMVIGMVGRIDRQKGQKELIEAMPQVLQRFANLRLVLVGEETLGEVGLKAELENLTRQLKIEKQTVFLGHRTDTPQLMASFDIMVVPSYEEAFGNVVIEGMASGCAMIGTDAGGIPEILDFGKRGLLVPPKSATGIESALIQYLSDQSLRFEMAQIARQAAESVYRYETVMAQIERLLVAP